MRHATAIIGAVGEHLAREHLQEAGWHVSDEDFRGGNTQDLDLIATSPGGSTKLEIQVKATTTDHAGISWQKPGREVVDPWIAGAAARGHQAVFIMIQGDKASVRVEPDPDREGFFLPKPEGFFLPKPKVLQMTAMTAEDFGDLVDERRAEYGNYKRQRLYRGHGAIGEPLSPKNVRTPVYVDDGEPLEDFLKRREIPYLAVDGRVGTWGPPQPSGAGGHHVERRIADRRP
jgi:hypothetical protein